MENISFEDSPRVGASKDPVDNPNGLSKPRSDPSGKDQNSNIPPLARITDDEDNESPPAKKKNIQDDLDLEQPPTDPVPGPHVDRSDPESKAVQRKRQQYRIDQLGPGSVSPDPRIAIPFPAPQQIPVPAAQMGQQEANADNPEQQEAVAGQEVDNPPVPGEQGVAEPHPADPGQQADNAPVVAHTWRELCVSCCEGMNSFHFQFAFYTVLLVLAVATGALGAMNWGYCAMNNSLPYVMIFVACWATMTIANRLLAIYYEQQFPDFSIPHWWIAVRIMEVMTWVSFSCQLGLFFMQTPSFNPSKTPYCLPKLYRINCAFMLINSALMVLWIVVNVRKVINCLITLLRRRNEHRNA